MANIHILERTGSDSFRVVCHFPTPTGNNTAGVPWATVMQRAKANGLQSVLVAGDGTGGTISSAEQAALTAGTTVEVVTEWAILTGGATNPQVTTMLDAQYVVEQAALQTRLGRAYGQYGRVR